MKKKDNMEHVPMRTIKKIKWDKQAIKNFEGFLKEMFGEHGKIVTNK